MLILIVRSVIVAAAIGSPALLSDQEVTRAIEQAVRLTDKTVCIVANAPGEFSVCVQGPEQRIGAVALLAKRMHRHLQAADIADDLKARTWVIYVVPNRPALVDGRPVRTPLAVSLTLQARNNPDAPAIEPLAMAQTQHGWENAVGVALKGQGVTATFDPLSLPPGVLDIIVRTEGEGERRYLLTVGARQRVR